MLQHHIINNNITKKNCWHQTSLSYQQQKRSLASLETTAVMPKTASIKKWFFILPIRISRYSEVIYCVYHCQNYHETEWYNDKFEIKI